MIGAVKEYTRQRAPRLFALARASKDQLMMEYRVLKRTQWRTIFAGLLARKMRWQKILPLQAPTEYTLESASSRHFLDEVLGEPSNWSFGAHTVYLDPKSWRSSPLAPLAALYNSDAGLKLIRNSGGIPETSYIHGRNHSRIQAKLSYPLSLLSLVANVLFRYNVGPRLYDLIEIRDGQNTRVAYVVQHVAAGEPDRVVCQQGVSRLKDLAQMSLLAPINENGFAHPDFSCPSCNGNAIISKEGEFRYVDFQNFVLPKYSAFLKRTALEAGEATHFGDKSLVRGGKYLYQSVPGVAVPAKRNVGLRAELLDQLLAEVGETIRGRLILDFGCNIGMMSAQYLARGAAWVHGWDQSAVIEHTERLLLALGCTRFSLTGGQLTADREITKDLPTPVVPLLDGAIVSYLAVRGHLGWLPALATTPWHLMIYEGHEREDRESTQRFLKELDEKIPIKILRLASVRDGDSDSREIALVQRLRVGVHKGQDRS
jgi:hypothetical protein